MLHSSTTRFSHRPYHFAMSVYFSAIKRDLAILTEWWQQRIAWWELLSAARQIICIRKQQHTWYKAYSAGQTVPSTTQIRAEGNNTKCAGKKRFNGSVTHGLRKEHVLRSPLSFCTTSDHICKSSPIAVIIVYSKSRDKWLENKLTWRNDRVCMKIVLYSSVAPLSEGKMVMNE